MAKADDKKADKTVADEKKVDDGKLKVIIFDHSLKYIKTIIK